MTKIKLRAERQYWVSNERGERDAFSASNIQQVRQIITTKMEHVLAADGHVSGGYSLQTKNGCNVVSNGEFRLVDGKAKYYPDYTEKEWS